MTKPNPLCNLAGGQVFLKMNSKEIWREVFLKPRYGRYFAGHFGIRWYGRYSAAPYVVVP